MPIIKSLNDLTTHLVKYNETKKTKLSGNQDTPTVLQIVGESGFITKISITSLDTEKWNEFTYIVNSYDDTITNEDTRAKPIHGYKIDTVDGFNRVLTEILDASKYINHTDAVSSFYNNINTRLHWKVRPILSYIQNNIRKVGMKLNTDYSYYELSLLTPYITNQKNNVLVFSQVRKASEGESANQVKLTNTEEYTTNVADWKLTDANTLKICVDYYSQINSNIRLLLNKVKEIINYADSKSDDIPNTHYQYLDFISIVEVVANDRQSYQTKKIEEVLALPNDTLLSTLYCDLPDTLEVLCQAFKYENKCSMQLFREVLCRQFKAVRYTTIQSDPNYYRQYGEDKRLYIVELPIPINGVLTSFYLTWRCDYYTPGDYDPQNKLLTCLLTKGLPDIIKQYRLLSDTESNTRY